MEQLEHACIHQIVIVSCTICDNGLLYESIAVSKLRCNRTDTHFVCQMCAHHKQIKYIRLNVIILFLFSILYSYTYIWPREFRKIRLKIGENTRCQKVACDGTIYIIRSLFVCLFVVAIVLLFLISFNFLIIQTVIILWDVNPYYHALSSTFTKTIFFTSIHRNFTVKCHLPTSHSNTIWTIKCCEKILYFTVSLWYAAADKESPQNRSIC